LDIVLFTTDMCSFCRRAKALLDTTGLPYREVYLPREDDPARRALAERTGRWTMPQVLVGDRPLGGWDELERLEATGRLRAALAGGSG
jgi:glutaredoxin 3